MQQTYITTTTQTMMTVTMTTLMMKTLLPKSKRIPILPTHTSGRMGAMARDCPIGVEVFVVVVVVVVACVSFPQTLVKGCVVLVCGCFGLFLALVCVWNEVFVPKYY